MHTLLQPARDSVRWSACRLSDSDMYITHFRITRPTEWLAVLVAQIVRVQPLVACRTQQTGAVLHASISTYKGMHCPRADPLTHFLPTASTYQNGAEFSHSMHSITTTKNTDLFRLVHGLLAARTLDARAPKAPARTRGAACGRRWAANGRVCILRRYR